MSIARFDYDRHTGRNKQPKKMVMVTNAGTIPNWVTQRFNEPQRHVMPVVTKMPLRRFAAAVEAHTAVHGEAPYMDWPTTDQTIQLPTVKLRKRYE